VSDKTKIEWADATWNPVTGCSPISAGCEHCYAKRLAVRFPQIHGQEFDEHLPDRDYVYDIPFEKIQFHPDRLEIPFHWRKPKKIFVCSMGDLFHKDVSFEFVNKVMAIAALNDQHIFMILTKRPERMLEYFCDYPSCGDDGNIANELTTTFAYETGIKWDLPGDNYNHIVGVDETYASSQYVLEENPPVKFPLRNLWLGVTAENQEMADKRIPLLLQIPAAKRFVSVEPMIGPVDLSYPLNGGPEQNGHGEWIQTFPPLDWVICGPETGAGARGMNLDWARSLRDQCVAASVPFFYKRGELDGRLWQQFPVSQ